MRKRRVSCGLEYDPAGTTGHLIRLSVPDHEKSVAETAFLPYGPQAEYRLRCGLEEVSECLAAKDSVEDELLAGEISAHINHFLGSMKKKDRVIFVRRYWFCMEIREIAEEMGESTNYVNVHLHRTREKLKKCLKAEGLLV